MKRPAFQFYPGDWRRDPALASCSLAARGLWIDLMCIAHESAEYGVLCINGAAMTTAQIARVVGEAPAVAAKLLAELETSGVFSRDGKGAIYSRRMVKDETVRNARAAGGEAGKSFGVLGAEHGSKGGRPTKARGVNKPPLEPPPSSSSSSSPSVNSVSDDTDGGTPPATPVPLPPVAKTPEELAKADLWRAAVSVLEQGGCPKSQCRTFMGKIVTDYGFLVVQQAVAAAVTAQPADAREYLKAACQRGAGHRPNVNKQEALERRNRNVADEWAAEGATQ